MKPLIHSNLAYLLWLICLAVASDPVSADSSACGDPFKNHYGPFDYRTASTQEKSLVEDAHFTAVVEQLKSGQSGWLAGDIGYTLHVFPNHPRALRSMSLLGLREKTLKPEHAAFTVDCYFDRAIRFRPDDGTVFMLYGIYQLKAGQRQNALKQLEKAAELSGDSANIHYNLGLAYFELKDYEKSLMHARDAYRLGFPLDGLRNMLAKVGKWSEQSPAAVDRQTKSIESSLEGAGLRAPAEATTPVNAQEAPQQ